MTAAGIVATATSPTSADSTALQLVGRSWLLLLVWAANGCGRDRPSDHAGDGDERQDIRQGLEERPVRRPALDVLEAGRHRGPENEKEGCAAGAGPPPP